MGKINIIIRREFNERVRKKSFLITTILTPLLFIGLLAAPVLLSGYRSGKAREIVVSDPSGVIGPSFESNERIKYHPVTQSASEVREEHKQGGYQNIYGILEIGPDILTDPTDVGFYTYGAAIMDVEQAVSSQLSALVEVEKISRYDVENINEILEDLRTKIRVNSISIDQSGTERVTSSSLTMIISYAFGVLIYLFIFLYGSMVMQGVVEEKSSKVLEIMVCSVKPFQLMMGKILGIASVAVTQFFIWVVLITLGSMVVMPLILPGVDPEALTAMGAGAVPDIDPQMLSAVSTLMDLRFMLTMFGGFLVYFIGGYLLYGAMFAAIGSAVDNMADSQQLQLPATVPLLIAFFVMINVMRDPYSPIAEWFSIIPFTSPIIMIARLPYGVPGWELALSIGLLYATFILMVWLAGKIYRVGIFMTGKKPSLLEFIKWARYKN